MNKGFHRKLLAGLLALGLVLTPMAAVAQTASRYWWQVIDEQGRSYLGQTVRCSVYSLGTGTALAYHFSSNLSAVGSTMPLLSDARGLFHFWSSAQTDVGVLCNTASGGIGSARLRYTDHTIMIDRQGRKVVRFYATTNASRTATNIFIPGGSVIKDVIVQNMAAGQVHLNVGFLGNHLGAHNASALIHGMALSTAGFLRPGATIGRASGSTGANASQWGGTGGDSGNAPFITGNHRGVALSVSHVVARGASGVALISGDTGMYATGFYLETPYMVPEAGVELVYSTSAGDIKAHVFVMFDAYHTGAGIATDYRW